MSEQIYANAFGGQFPVCNEKQKQDLEKAYKAVESVNPVGDDGCTCDLITRLLNGTASHMDQICGAISVARETYRIKVGEIENRPIVVVMSAGRGGQPSKETVH